MATPKHDRSTHRASSTSSHLSICHHCPALPINTLIRRKSMSGKIKASSQVTFNYPPRSLFHSGWPSDDAVCMHSDVLLSGSASKLDPVFESQPQFSHPLLCLVVPGTSDRWCRVTVWYITDLLLCHLTHLESLLSTLQSAQFNRSFLPHKSTIRLYTIRHHAAHQRRPLFPPRRSPCPWAN